MKKQKFEELKALLKERGYKIYHQHWHHEDYVIGKGFHKEDNQWEEDRFSYQLLLSVYDYSKKPEYWDRIPEIMRDMVGIEVRVDISRTIDERLEVVFAWHEDESIERVEYMAEQFYNATCTILKEPREEKPTLE